jgi:hypothetical protein
LTQANVLAQNLADKTGSRVVAAAVKLPSGHLPLPS